MGTELAAGAAAVTEVRAAVILGAGSASFEMLRSLVEVLPVMLAPRWVTTTQVQPIAIGDVLSYLVAAVTVRWPRSPPDRADRRPRPDDLPRPDRTPTPPQPVWPAGCVVPVPVVTPRLSSHWVNVVTPLPRQLARSLIESLVNDVVVTDRSADELATVDTLDATPRRSGSPSRR